MAAAEALLAKIDSRRFVGGEVGLPTVEDILRELEKPGRDPRRELQTPRFAEGGGAARRTSSRPWSSRGW